jgi:hypothetical protein
LYGLLVRQFLGQARFAKLLDFFRPCGPDGVDFVKRLLACGCRRLKLAEDKLCLWP